MKTSKIQELFYLMTERYPKRFLHSGYGKKSIFRKYFGSGSSEGQKGIYVLYSKGKPYYVGRAGSGVYNRVMNHLRDRHKDKWDHFQMFSIKNKYKGVVEALLIEIASPPGNRRKERRYIDAIKKISA